MSYCEAFAKQVDALRHEESLGINVKHRDQFHRYAYVQSLDRWDEIQEFLNGPLQETAWIFRGQPNQCAFGLDCRLTSSLERAVLRYRKVDAGLQPEPSNIPRHPNEFEPWLIKRFQSQAHHYIANPPPEEEVLEWLALMQHHGVPTRLMDWTLSPYVALYFALEACKSEGYCALWAIDEVWLSNQSRIQDSQLPRASDEKAVSRYINQVLLGGTGASTITLARPARMNERSASQQGVFLLDLGSSETFDLTLLKMLASYLLNPSTSTDDHEFSTESLLCDELTRPPVWKIVINTVERSRILKELRRMNIHAGSLFPGLDGFARSISLELQVKIDQAYEELGWKTQA